MDQWEYLGIHFGYPECCRKTFKTMMGALGNPLGAQAGQDTGFIPCPTHAKQVLNGEILLEDIIENRLHSLPFPNTNDNEALEAFKKT